MCVLADSLTRRYDADQKNTLELLVNEKNHRRYTVSSLAFSPFWGQAHWWAGCTETITVTTGPLPPNSAWMVRLMIDSSSLTLFPALSAQGEQLYINHDGMERAERAA